MPLSEVCDRATILMVRKEKGVSHEGLEDYQKEAKQVNKELLQELFEVNWALWELEDKITHARDNREAGWIFRNRSRPFTKKRSEIKNKITEKYGGYHETKAYD